jgi:hypothetical protein
MALSRVSARSPVGRVDLADRLTIWAIWLLLLGGGIVREVLGQTEVFSFGFYTLHSVDPGIFIAGCAALLHLAHRRLAWHLYTIPVLLMASLILLNFIRGVGSDPSDALLWFRANGGIATMLVLAICMRPTLPVIRALRKALLVCALGLIVLIALRLVGGPTLFMTSGVSVAEANDGGRPLSAFGAFLLVLASTLALSELIARRRIALDWRTIYAFALPLAVVATLQVTVGLAELTAVATLLCLQHGQPRWLRLGFGALLVAAVGLLLSFPSVTNNAMLVHRTENLDTRRQVWDALTTLWSRLPLSTQLLGYPAGELPNLYVFSHGSYRPWEQSIHSMYYGSLPMMGYIGLIAYLAFLIILSLECLIGALRKHNPLSTVPLACCVATAVLSYSYEVRSEALIGFFIAIWWLRASAARMTARVPAGDRLVLQPAARRPSPLAQGPFPPAAR